MKKLFIYILLTAFAVSAFAADKIYDEKGDFSDVLSDCMSTDPADKKRAEDFIRVKHPRALAVLLASMALDDKSQGRRMAAFNALKFFPVNQTSDVWVDLLGRTESFIQKKEIIEFLSSYNSRSFVVPFSKELSSPYSIVRQTAAMALKKYADDRAFPYILDLAASGDPVRRIYAIEAMFHLYDRRLLPVMNDLLKDENKSVRVYAIKCAVSNNLTNVNQLIRDSALNDPVQEVRIAAIEALGDIKDSGAAGQLGRTVADQNRDIRLKTVEAFYKINSYGAAQYLSAQLSVEQDEEIIDRILDCFINFKRTNSIPPIEKVMLGAANVRLRIKAAYVLGIIKDDRAVQSLVKAFSDTDHRVRAEACASIGNYKVKNAVPELLEVIKNDKVRYVRSAALYSVKRLNDKSSLGKLFEIFSEENDPVFRELLRRVIAGMIDKYTYNFPLFTEWRAFNSLES